MTARRFDAEDIEGDAWFVPHTNHLAEVIARLRLGSVTVALTTASGETWLGIGTLSDDAISVRGWGVARSFALSDLVSGRTIVGYFPRLAQEPIVRRQSRGEPAHRAERGAR